MTFVRGCVPIVVHMAPYHGSLRGPGLRDMELERTAATAMTSAERETVARRWYDDLYEGRDLAALVEIVTSDCTLHFPGGGSAERPDAIRSALDSYHTTFAGARWTIHDVITARDRVVVRASGESRYVGGWHGIPGSGQMVTESCITIFRFSGSRIAEVWLEVSDLDVARQLGEFPP